MATSALAAKGLDAQGHGQCQADTGWRGVFHFRHPGLPEGPPLPAACIRVLIVASRYRLTTTGKTTEILTRALDVCLLSQLTS